MRDQIIITIPVKPYIYKYVSAIEGAPLYYTSRTLICATLRELFDKDHPGFKVETDDLHAYLYAPDVRTHELKFVVPDRYTHKVVKDPQEESIIACNLFLESHLENSLQLFVESNKRTMNRYEGYKDIIMNFARLHRISVEEDISYDGLQKKEYRLRKKNIGTSNVFPLALRQVV